MVQEKQAAFAASQGTDVDSDSALLVLIGLSTVQDRFQAWLFSSHSDFDATEQPDPFLFPMPPVYRPSTYEQECIRSRGEGLLPILKQVVELPEMTAPTSVKGWVDLAQHARRTRALADVRTFMKSLVGGELHYTRLERGEQRIRLVHRFNDEGAEFARLVKGTAHPSALAAPCPFCPSGKPFGACCGTALAEGTARRKPVETRQLEGDDG
jgi:hypothetical protein